MLRRALILGLLSLAALATACGSDDEATEDPVATVATVDPVAAYEAAVADISARTVEATSELSEPISDALRNGSTTTVLERASEFLPQIVASHQAGIAELESLVPPERYAADHARYIEGERSLIAIFEQMIESIEGAGALTLEAHIVALEQSFEELGTVHRVRLNDLSTEFAQLAFTDDGISPFALLGGGLLAGGLTPEEEQYVEALRGGVNEFGSKAAAFRRAAQQTYPTAERLMVALGEAGAGEAMQAAYDVVSQIEPPETFTADHALVVAYYEEAVRIDTRIGEAARNGDAAAFLVADVELRQAAQLAALGLHPAVCSVLFDPALCSAAADSPPSQYEQGIQLAFLDLMIQFGPTGPWGGFRLLPAGSDDVIVQAAAVLAPEAIDQLQQTRALLAALEPSDALEADHAALLAYLDQLLVHQDSIIVAATAGNAEGIRAGIDSTVQATCTTSLELGEPARPVVAFYFGAEPGRPAVIGVCPGA